MSKLSEEKIKEVQSAAYKTLAANGYTGGMGGVQWDMAHARAIEAAVLEAQGKQEPWPFSADRVTYHKAAPVVQPAELAAEYTRGRNDGWEAAEAKYKQVVQPDMVMEGFKAACAFIDSHAADPDITSEMRKTYAEFMRMRTMIAAAEGKSNAEGKPTPD